MTKVTVENLIASIVVMLIVCAIASAFTNFVLSYVINWPMTFDNFAVTFGLVYCYRMITKFSRKDFSEI
tara:strand:+ start:518 stop:724 length:207 start_codon:yes stop_codon:yes gene_type:complete